MKFAKLTQGIKVLDNDLKESITIVTLGKGIMRPVYKYVCHLSSCHIGLILRLVNVTGIVTSDILDIKE